MLMAMVAVAVEKPLPVDPNGGCDHVTATKRSACLLRHHSGDGNGGGGSGESPVVVIIGITAITFRFG